MQVFFLLPTDHSFHGTDCGYTDREEQLNGLHSHPHTHYSEKSVQRTHNQWWYNTTVGSHNALQNWQWIQSLIRLKSLIEYNRCEPLPSWWSPPPPFPPPPSTNFDCFLSWLFVSGSTSCLFLHSPFYTSTPHFLPVPTPSHLCDTANSPFYLSFKILVSHIPTG